MSKSKVQIQDKDFVYAETALRRAARKARKIAAITRTPLIVYEDGCVVKKFPGKGKSS